MANFGTTEILIVLFVVMLLFGSAKLPQFARSLGKSARILRAETRGLHDEDDPPAAPRTPPSNGTRGILLGPSPCPHPTPGTHEPSPTRPAAIYLPADPRSPGTPRHPRPGRSPFPDPDTDRRLESTRTTSERRLGSPNRETPERTRAPRETDP